MALRIKIYIKMPYLYLFLIFLAVTLKASYFYSVVHPLTSHFQRNGWVGKGAIGDLFEYPLVSCLSEMNPIPINPNWWIFACICNQHLLAIHGNLFPTPSRIVEIILPAVATASYKRELKSCKIPMNRFKDVKHRIMHKELGTLTIIFRIG